MYEDRKVGQEICQLLSGNENALRYKMWKGCL